MSYTLSLVKTPQNSSEIKFHLITLDENGSFTCQTGGEELAAVFYNGYDSPALHPLSFHVSSLGDSLARIHVMGK